VAYFAAAAFLISAVTSRARKLPSRGRVKEKKDVLAGRQFDAFDCAYFVRSA
jgi:hypothetical protein